MHGGSSIAVYRGAMRRAWLLVPLVLALVGCLPAAPSPEPTTSIPDEPTVLPDDLPAAYEELAASLSTADGVTGVEGGHDGIAPFLWIEVADDIDRLELQNLTHQIRRDAETLGLDLVDCVCTIGSDAAYNDVIAWFTSDLPVDTTPLLDVWEWLAALSVDYVPELSLEMPGAVSGYGEVDDASWAAPFFEGVAEGGAIVDVLGEEVSVVSFVTLDGAYPCFSASISTAIKPEAAELLTSLVSEGFGDVDELCLNVLADESGLLLDSALELGGSEDPQLLADVVAAFEEAGVEVGF